MVLVGGLAATLGIGYLAYNSLSKPKKPAKKETLSGSLKKGTITSKSSSNTSKVKTIQLS